MQLRSRVIPAHATVANLAVALATLSITPTCAQPGQVRDLLGDKPMLHITTFESGPALDGVLDDEAWASAEPAGPFWHFQTGAPSKHDTTAWMGLDSENLYVAFRCAEAEMGKLKVDRLPPDSMTVYARDHVEFFFAPDALKPTYYHFSVDVAGNRHDEMPGDDSWRRDWEAAVSREADNWTVEMRIPRDAIGLRKPRMSLANFCRTRRIEPGETSAWSKTSGIFHNPARFGRVVYGPPADVSLQSVSINHPRVADNRIDVLVAGKQRPGDVVVRAHMLTENGMSLIGARELQVTDGRTASVSIPLRVKRTLTTRLTITLKLDGRVVSFADASEVNLAGREVAPIRQVLGPEARPSMRWLDTQRLRGISYGFTFLSPMPDDGLVNAEPPAPVGPGPSLHLRGESYFRLHVRDGEEVRFTLAPEAGDSPFTDSIYALFWPRGKMLGKGVVAAGTESEIRIETYTPGAHTLLVNSGPASWNPYAIAIENPYWVLDARGKSRYVGTPVSLHSLRDCKLAGLNVGLTAAFLYGSFETDEDLVQWRGKLEQVCRASQDAGMKLIPYVGWGCVKVECDAAGDYVRALTRLPVRGPNPCPVSREYWERTFLRRALAIAELSETYPCVIGVGLDPEAYYFGNWYAENLESPEDKRLASSTYMPYGASREKCICDDCLRGLLDSKGIADPGLPEDGNARFDWVAENDLLDDLCAYQQARLEEVFTSIRERVHAVNPELQFAVLLLSSADNWFCRGTARALSTAGVPALDFDENTYISGYSVRAVQDKIDRYDGWGARVAHGGCLWAMKHPPHNPNFLSAQMFNFGIYGHGYWFWPGFSSVWRSADTLGGYFSLSGYSEDYWKAIVVANQEIERRVAAPTSYRSPLERIEARLTIPASPAGSESNEWAKKPCYPVHVCAGTRLSFTVPDTSDSIRVEWGYRETLGDRALLVNVAGTERRLNARVEAEKVNISEFVVPEGGCAGWIEFEGAEGPGECIGVNIVGAKPFFGGEPGMTLR